MPSVDNMNERIRELAEQANEWASKEESYKAHSQLFTEKFAELIVEECMRMCDVADMSLLEHNCVKEASGTQSAKDFIKEHFGFEE
jgi:hypothetical protein